MIENMTNLERNVRVAFEACFQRGSAVGQPPVVDDNGDLVSDVPQQD